MGQKLLAASVVGLALLASPIDAAVVREDVPTVDGDAYFSWLGFSYPADSVIFDGYWAFKGTYPDATFPTADSQAPNVPTQEMWTLSLSSLFGFDEASVGIGFVRQDYYTLLPLTGGDTILSAFHYDSLNGGWGSGFLSEETAPAPEPASWVLTLGGLGLVGSALRRRKSSVSFA